MTDPQRATPGGSGQANADQETANPAIVVDIDAERKAFSTMQARAALCGCTLHELADGAFLVGRWNCSKVVPCLRAVGDLLCQIGGR